MSNAFQTLVDRSTDDEIPFNAMGNTASLPEATPQVLFEALGDTIYQTAPENPANVPIRSKDGQPEKESKPRSHLFNRESATLAAQRSAEARRLKKHLASLPPPPPKEPTDEALLTQKRLEQLSKQIARTVKTLDDNELPVICPHCSELVNGCISPRDRAQLLNALDRLLERERILRGIAAPAPFRAPRQTRQSSNNTAEPL